MEKEMQLHFNYLDDDVRKHLKDIISRMDSDNVNLNTVAHWLKQKNLENLPVEDVINEHLQALSAGDSAWLEVVDKEKGFYRKTELIKDKTEQKKLELQQRRNNLTSIMR
jgi:hypothetical protein